MDIEIKFIRKDDKVSVNDFALMAHLTKVIQDALVQVIAENGGAHNLLVNTYQSR